MASTAVYANRLELRARIEKDKDASDGVLDALLFAASRAIDGYTNRAQDGYVASAAGVARLYVGSGTPFQMIDECAAVESVAVKDSISDTSYTAWADSDWIAARGSPDFPQFHGTPYTLLVADINGDYAVFTSGWGASKTALWPDTGASQRDLKLRQPTVQVTARWGYAATVPKAIREATIMQAARWYERLKVGMADSLATTELGDLRFTQDLDPDVQFILRLGRWVRPPMTE
jgi:hypothetical protein